MRHYLLLGIGLALASCATQRQLTPPPDATSGGHDEGRAYTPAMLTQRPDSVVITRQPSLLDKMLGREPKPYHVAVTPARIGKKATINVYNAPATVTTLGKNATGAVGAGATASVIEKKAGPAVVASDSSTQNAILGAGNLAAVHGDGNTLPQTTTTQEASGWKATLAKPAGYALAGLGTVLIVGGCLYLIIAYKRRKVLTSNG